MTIKETPVYRFKYMDPNEPFMNLPGVTQQVAERLEQALDDAQIPPGNPDLNDVLARLAAIDAGNARRAYAVAAGKVNVTVPANNTSGAAFFTFPPGRFTVPPIVTCAKQDGTNADYVEFIRNITKDGAEVVLYTSPAGGGGITSVGWTAVQMTPTAAAG